MTEKCKQVFEEFQEYSDNIDYCQFFVEMHPTDETKLVVFFEGEKESIHQEGIYLAEFAFLDDYPNSSPKGKFLEPLPYNCNISSEGLICLDYYKKWNKNFNFNCLLEAISYVLHHPNPQSSFRKPISDEQNQNFDLYQQNVKKQALVCKQAFLKSNINY